MPNAPIPPINSDSVVSQANGIWYIDGVMVPWESIPMTQRPAFAERLKALYASQQDQDVATGALDIAPAERTTEETEAVASTDFVDAVEELGLIADPLSMTLEQVLGQTGIDVDNPEVRMFITNYADVLWDAETGTLTDQGTILIGQMAQDPRFMAAPQTAYTQALADSGFGATFGGPGGSLWEAGAETGLPAAISGRKPPTTKFESNAESGWTRFPNGVLVSPDGQLAFDPASTAPGSAPWLRDVVSTWSEEKVAEWRKRLHEFGYLTKDQAKVSGVDVTMQSALKLYHANRYVNGGKPVAGDLAGTGAAGGKFADQPLLNFEDMAAQIRNDVREQYRRVFGTDPTDGDVAAWSDYIMSTGMKLQKEYRRKEYGSYQTLAATEAEELFVEKLENSPQAQFLGDAAEENTRMRDALERAVMVTQSLAG